MTKFFTSTQKQTRKNNKVFYCLYWQTAEACLSPALKSPRIVLLDRQQLQQQGYQQKPTENPFLWDRLASELPDLLLHWCLRFSGARLVSRWRHPQQREAHRLKVRHTRVNKVTPTTKATEQWSPSKTVWWIEPWGDRRPDAFSKPNTVGSVT